MNTAEVEALHQALAAQGRYVDKQALRIKELTEQLSLLSMSVSQTAAHAAGLRAAHSPAIDKPEKYDGEPSHCRGFTMLRNLQDEQKVAHIIGLLTGKALQAIWDKGG